MDHIAARRSLTYTTPSSVITTAFTIPSPVPPLISHSAFLWCFSLPLLAFVHNVTRSRPLILIRNLTTVHSVDSLVCWILI
jgi:hypothetical protein